MSGVGRQLAGWWLVAALAVVPAFAQGDRFAGLGLEPLPDPEVSGMETAVARQLTEERARVAGLLAAPDSSPAALGEGFGRLGQLYYGYALRRPAAVCYRNAIRLMPDGARWHYYLGVVHQDEGRADEALAALGRAHELEPYVPALVRQGDIELGRNRPELAGPLYEGALAAYPSSAAAHFGLGRVAVAAGDDALAVAHFEKALELQPQADRIHHPLGQAYRRLGEAARARDHLRRAGPTQVAFYDPRMVELQRLAVGASAALDRAAEARMQGLYEVALGEYRSAVEADPDNAVARRSLASMLTVVGRDQEAIAEFRRALELEPDRADALMALGLLLARHGEKAEARTHLERSTERDPRLAPARMALAALLAEAGEWDAAAERYREVLVIDPDDAEARLELGKALVQTGRAAEGLAQFDAVLKGPAGAADKARAELYRAIAELRGGAAEEAIPRLERAVELDPELAEARFTLGRVLLERRRFDEAAAELGRLLELQPANAGARLARMSALALAGRLGEAVAELEAGLVAVPESRELRFNLARLLACAPDRAARDGARALALAEELLREAPTGEHAETVAMALAESGRFAEAAQLQGELVEGLGERAPAGLVAQLRHNLERYRRGERCELGVAAPGPPGR